MRFCGRCGAPLAEAGPPDGGTGRRTPRAEAAERRHICVLFCDLADSTRLGAALDPEDLRRILLAYREACARAVERCGGTVAQYVGDGLVAYFGFPRAHEDDAHRAVKAGLQALAEMRDVNAALSTEGLGPLRVRIGVHAGLAVVGDLGSGARKERTTAVGDTTNTAARLQQLAEPDQVVVSEAVLRLVEGHFRVADLGVQELRGLARPIRAHAVLGETPLRSRFEARPVTTPFVNREEVMRRLLDLWGQVRRGAGVVVALEGEPGIGKSRVVHEFRKRIGPAGRCAHVIGCGADDRASAFHPVVAWLRTLIDAAPEDATEVQRAMLDAALEAAGVPAPEFGPPLATLLGVARPEEEAELAAVPRRRRRRVIEALLALLLAEAAPTPVLLIVEDGHWADDSTLTFLRALADRAAGAQLMVLLTARTGGAPPGWWPPERIVLERLSPSHARELARGVAAADGLNAGLLEHIVERTDGVPLFVEEVTRTAVGHDPADGGAVSLTEIPMTLRGSLMAQLDLLLEAKPVAQLAAVLGRSVRTDFLEAVAAELLGLSAEAVHGALQRLVEARFLIPDGGSTFDFRHALIQESAYDSLLREQRRRYHLGVVAALRGPFSEAAAARPEELARHLAAAGENAQAVDAYEAAALRAGRQSAAMEAVAHYRRALELLRSLPEAPHWTAREADLQIALAAQLVAARGNADPGIAAALDRGQQLARSLGDRRLLLRSLRGLQTYHLVRGDIEAGHRISLQLLESAADERDPSALIQIWRPHGLCLLYLGRFAEARRELERVLAHYDPARHAAQRFEYGSDPGVLARCHLSWVEWFLGRPAAAAVHAEAAVAAARALDHPHSLAFALAFLACLGQFENRPSATRAAAEEMIRVAHSLDYPYWVAWGEILLGWALARSGEDRQAGEELLRKGLSDYAATGAGLLRPYALHLLADLIGDGPRRGEAVALLDEALNECRARSILFWQAEILRLKGELLAAVDPMAAEASLMEAVRIADQQGAVASAERASGSLLRFNRVTER
jgi:class 3 adenylate cyclase/tetratricopeptide (TPR) repeat protein